MFTGLVRAVGRLERCPAGVRVHLPLESHGSANSGPGGLGGLARGELALGDSVSVDGVCLTVAECLADGFRADVSEETLARTTLAARAAAAAAVNLEPALRLSDRLGGHLVSGHVDGLGRVEAIERQSASWLLAVRWHDPRFGRYLCEKASVAVDGISLTVVDCDADALFRVAVIPHTWSSTTLARRRVGDEVNLEADLLAKYTERLLGLAGGHGGYPGGAEAGVPGRGAGISAAWLAEQGWG